MRRLSEVCASLVRRTWLLAAAIPLLLQGAELRAQPPRGEARTVKGVVREFTTAPKGEVDGLVLKDGTVLHWPPHLERRYARLAARGDRVEATGRMETGPEGDTHLEVQTLTNLSADAGRDSGRRGSGRGGKED